MTTPTPLVTVICVCYNHAPFVTEALDSVANQTYSNIELIVIDDGSSDGSAKVIKKWIASHPQTTLLVNANNQGYCKTFNKAFAVSKGMFCIDLAADDVLLPDRIEKGVQLFEQAGEKCGIIFSNAEYIDDRGNFLRLHSDKYPHQSIPQGDVYLHVIDRYFICPTSMMMRRSMIESLSGYDESLAYEDFDLWIRAARDYSFHYSSEVLVRKRELEHSMLKKQFKRSSPQRWSTLEVCKKIKTLNRTKQENKALRRRIWYEIRLSLKMFDFKLAYAFWKLLFTND